jgi:hypothetical protein
MTKPADAPRHYAQAAASAAGPTGGFGPPARRTRSSRAVERFTIEIAALDERDRGAARRSTPLSV